MLSFNENVIVLVVIVNVNECFSQLLHGIEGDLKTMIQPNLK